ncbi:MAG TPA: HlyD family secretion protein [Acetobacteraceae bacterium]|nr:HlyD family secretion protein [Acetobacteraceae bacterium]
MDVPTQPDPTQRDAAAEPGRPADTPTPTRRWYHRHPWLAGLGALVVLILLAGGVLWWLNARNYASTSDARIAGYVVQMAPQVSGRVTKLLFTDNQHVNAGQVLVAIDPRDYQAKLDQALAQQASAQAQVTQARAQLMVRQADLDQARASVAVAQADLTQAQKDYDRFRHINPAAVAQQQRDQADAAFRSATAKLTSAKQAVEGAEAQIEAAKAQVASAQAGARQAEAAVEGARLQLSYATLNAPVAGRVAHRTVNVGDVVQPGQALFALVQDELWVEADFKETELAGMRPGQTVTITVDAVPGTTFHGTVNSFQPGTGSVFSALPAENATGNWVKVVQRVPVKIVFDGTEYQKYFLAPGMSVEPSVKLR